LDIPHELFDSAGCSERLLALQADQGRLGLAIREGEVHDAAEQQHAADEQDEDSHVFAEQTARRQTLHRRMMSARKRICRGATSPKDSTVLRLTARMTRSAPSTGRSRGSVPRRIFQTNRAACAPCAR